MKLLFSALEARFDSDAQLVLHCRKLYMGFAGDRAKGILPYAEVYREGGGQDDSFDRDLEVYNLRFNLFGDRHVPDRMNDSVEHFMRVFDDANLTGVFSLVSINRIGGPIGPFIRDGTYQAIISYEVVLQRLVGLPLVRGV